MLQQKLQNERQRFQADISVLQQKLHQDSQRHQDVETVLRKELESVRERLQDKLDYVGDIQISDALYLEFKQIETHHRTLKEHVQIRVYETIAPFR